MGGEGVVIIAECSFHLFFLSGPFWGEAGDSSWLVLPLVLAWLFFLGGVEGQIKCLLLIPEKIRS